MKNNFSDQARQYAIYRPTYPPELFEFLMEHVNQREAVWDCATGNGQTAVALAKYFEQVYATDISQQQLNNAQFGPNITYSLQAAEHTAFEDDKFNLVTVSQALHWFQFDAFYKEVYRVTKTGGVFAAWAYSLLTISPEIDEYIRDYHFNILKDHWDEERRFVDERYESIPFPFDEIASPDFVITYDWSLENLEGYLQTWSAYQNFVKSNGFDPVEALIIKIRPYWSEKRRVVFPVHMRVGRVK
ncbi:class I SAM-dependent methyltransferase [Terrimonas sp. NA20]|uniref:Class I SAM-dependent methyltransferase n=1 Tax=Terrimonas ginsenosidimutans TaxID=2908004 RepID=A0ABS9KKX6_9BACT|nr:class I SAM-dependent methyltransferase [Terrimonas ginsenosidimutans]MCG2612976.1 class I SAM-dependent methyltransferase [Terrimonas ginsenosidimutans]